MALMINIDSFVSAGFTNPVRWDLIETGTGIKIDEHAEAGPHGVVYNFSFTDSIQDIVYTIRFYDVPGGIGLGNLIKSHDVTVSTSTVQDGEIIEIIVDGGQAYDPVNEATSVVIDALHGKDFWIEQRGVGTLRGTRVNEYTWDDTTNTLTLTGNIFVTDDSYFAHIKAKYVVNPAGSQSPSRIYRDVELVTADKTLTNLDTGKLFIVDGALPVVTITFPAIADITAKSSTFFQSIGTTHNNLVLKAASGELITRQAGTGNTFILGKGETAEVLKLSTTLYGFTDSEDIKRTGQFEWCYGTILNRLWANGSIILAADYPRLKEALDAGRCGTVKTYAEWATTSTIDGVAVPINKGFFALSVDGLSIQLPDLRNKFIRALRYSDGTSDAERYSQLSGGYQHDDNKPHYHDSNAEVLTGGNGAGGTRNRGNFNTKNSGTVEKSGTSGTTESRGRNIGLIPCIIF